MHLENPTKREYDTARKVFDLAMGEKKLPSKVIDDGCHERTEAIINMALINNINANLLDRVFVINTLVGNTLSMEKPLSRNGELHKWFDKEMSKNQLQHGAVYSIGNSIFDVDNYLALRARAMSGIYLDSNPIAHWGVGHVAVLVGNFIIDTGADDVLTFEDWQSKLNIAGLITLKAKNGKVPELFVDKLDQEALKLVIQSINNAFGQNLSNKQEISTFYLQLSEEGKVRFFDELFSDQIESKGIYSRNYWNELYLGALTSRGEDLDNFSAEKRQLLSEQLKSTSNEERLALALKTLEPYQDYQNLILGADFNWTPPKTN